MDGFVPETPYLMKTCHQESLVDKCFTYVNDTPLTCQEISEVSCVRCDSGKENSFQQNMKSFHGSEERETMSFTLMGSSNDNVITDCPMTPSKRLKSSLPHLFEPSIDYPGDNTNILKGTQIYIQVVSGRNDRSSCFVPFLENMGAKVLSRIGKTVTHVVFLNGSTDTFERGLKYGAVFVNPRWVEECRLKGCKAKEEDFPIRNKEAYEEPFIYGRIKVPCQYGSAEICSDPRWMKKRQRINRASNEDTPVGFREPRRRRFRLMNTNADLYLDSYSKNKPECRDKNILKLPFLPINSDLIPSSPPTNPSKRKPLQTLDEQPHKKAKMSPVCATDESFDTSYKQAFKNIRRTTMLLKQLLESPPEGHSNNIQCAPLSSSKSEEPVQDRTSDYDSQSTVSEAITKENRLGAVAFTNVKGDLKYPASVVSRFGGTLLFVAKYEPSWTHLICESKRRTLKVLYALVQGCWIVRLSWLYNSLDSGTLAKESDYEAIDMYPSCQKYREYREKQKKVDLLEGVGLIYISKSVFCPERSLRELVTLAGGKTTAIIRHAQVVVGQYYRHSPISVNECWLLDSLEHFRVCSYDDYLLSEAIVHVD